MDWTPALPAPPSSNWREAYGAVKNGNIYTLSDTPTQTSYQAPSSQPVPFVYDSMKLSAGLSVDTEEYPFFGLWSSTPLNEKPHGITVSGFLRGDNYIKNRNALVEALRVPATDDDPGYLSLPLWGRFPVIVVDWDIEESGKESGQCKIQLTFTRAGCPIKERWALTGELTKTIPEAAEAVKLAITDVYEKRLRGNTADQVLVNSFNLIRQKLFTTVGRIQGNFKNLNEMTNAASRLSNLLAQGVRSPKILAESLFASAGKIVSGISEIKNAADETVSFFRTTNNEKNTLFCFFAEYKYSLPIEAVTVKQVMTKRETENLYRAAALYSAAQLLPEVTTQSYDKTANLFALYGRLEQSVDGSDPAVYEAVNDLRIAVSKDLASRQLSQELSISLNGTMPMLALAHYLGAEEAVLRALNGIEDSFVLEGTVRYV